MAEEEDEDELTPFLLSMMLLSLLMLFDWGAALLLGKDWPLVLPPKISLLPLPVLMKVE